MGIDGMRVAGGRCPPLLVGGLLIACLMLICNWWTLSSENIELVRQVDELNEQLKISAEEREQCITSRTNLEHRYKHTEDKLASLQINLEQQNELKKKEDELEHTLLMCKSELDSLNKLDATKTATLETLRLEKETINAQLDVKRDQNKKLQEDVDRLKEEVETVKQSCNAVPEKKPQITLQPETSAKQQNNDTANDPVEQDMTDQGEENPDISNQGGGGVIETESERDQQMKVTTDPDKLEAEKK